MQWLIRELTNTNLDLLLEINRKKQITKKSQETYKSSIGYYFAIWSLRDMHLIQENGHAGNKNEKIWSLTPNGELLIKHMNNIENLLKRCQQNG
jgi:predicted transcriptional regulator